MVKALETDAYEEVRQSAAYALGEIGPAAKAAVPALIKALATDADKYVRRGAASALETLALDFSNAKAVDMIKPLENAQKTLLATGNDKEATTVGLSI